MNDVEAKSQSLLSRAAAARASDIHLTPRQDDTLIRFRVDGRLRDVDTISKRFAEKLVSHFKFLSGMDIGEKRRPQNGAFDMNVDRHSLNLRLSTLPTPFNESLVVRLLSQEQSYTLSELSLFPEGYRQLVSLLDNAGGLILLTGPTGSGKTTLLYALLNAAVKQNNRHVVTLEDPIEKKNDAFVQMQLNEKADITYAQGFKSILRHDPDIIMVGEIRDTETAKIAVRAALTGHKVLSTVHTQDTIGCVYRLLELGIPLSHLKQTLTGIVAQRLVNLVCPFCGDACSPECLMYRRRRRLGIYEILSGLPLSTFLSSLQQSFEDPYIPPFKKLKDLVKKGIAFGFLSEKSYDGLGGDAYEA